MCSINSVSVSIQYIRYSEQLSAYKQHASLMKIKMSYLEATFLFWKWITSDNVQILKQFFMNSSIAVQICMVLS